MTSLVLRHVRVAPVGALLAAIAFLAWATVTLGLWLGELRPPHPRVVDAALLVGPVLAGALMLRNAPVPRTTQALVGGMALFGSALWSAQLVSREPLVALAVPAVLATAVVARRWPAATVAAAFALTGARGSVIAFTPFEPGPLVDLLLGGLWVAVLLTLLLRSRDEAVIVWPGIVVAMMYVALSLAAVPLAPSVEDGVRAFRGGTWYLLAVPLVAYGGWRSATRKRIAQAIAAVSLAVGAYATLRWMIGPAGVEAELVKASDPLGYNIVAGEQRPVGSFGSGAELGFWTAACLPYCVAVALTMRGTTRIVGLLAVPLLTISVFGSQVRAAAVAAALGVVVVIVVQQFARSLGGLRLAFTVAAIVGCSVAAAAFYPATIGNDPERRERFSNVLTPERDPSFAERRYKWSHALREIRDRPFGHGIGSASGATFDIDSSYLRIAYEHGFVGMVLFSTALVLLFAGLLRRAIRTSDRDGAALATAACGTLAAIALVFTTRQLDGHIAALAPWIIIGLGIAPFTRATLPQRAAPAQPG